MKFSNKHIWGLIFIIPLFLFGCFTMLTHPDIENVDDQGNRYFVDVRFYDDCTACHTAEEIDAEQLIAYEMVSPYRYDEDSTSYSDDYYDYDRSGYRAGYRPNFPWWIEISPILRDLPLPTRNDRERIDERRRESGTRDLSDRGLDDLRLPSVGSGGGGSVGKNTSDDSTSDNDRRSNNTRNNRGNRSSNSRRK